MTCREVKLCSSQRAQAAMRGLASKFRCKQSWERLPTRFGISLPVLELPTRERPPPSHVSLLCPRCPYRPFEISVPLYFHGDLETL